MAMCVLHVVVWGVTTPGDVCVCGGLVCVFGVEGVGRSRKEQGKKGLKGKCGWYKERKAEGVGWRKKGSKERERERGRRKGRGRDREREGEGEE